MQGAKNRTPKILSIIVPMYESEQFIETCLDSCLDPEALCQTDMDRMEILVVNDGSKDGAVALVEAYVRRFPDTVRLLNKKNGGHGSAVNFAVPQCRGRFFKVVDADDRVNARGLNKILNILEDTEAFHADIVLAGYRMHDIRDGRIQTVSCGHKDTWMGMGGVLHGWGRYRRLFTLHGLIYRTDFYCMQGRLLPEHVYYDDAYFDVVFAACASGIYITGVILYEYRVGDASQSMSRRNRERRLGQLETVLWEICKTQKDGSRFTKAGTCYWYRRMSSFVADYYVTALLRAQNRRKGRSAAFLFSAKLRSENRKLYQMCRGRYWILCVMHMFHIRDTHLEAFFRIREIWRQRCVSTKER